MIEKIYNELIYINQFRDKKSFKINIYDTNNENKLVQIKTSEIWVDIFFEPFGAGGIINGKKYLWILLFEVNKPKSEYFVFEVGKFVNYKHEKFVKKLCDIEFFDFGLLEILKMVENDNVEEIIQTY